MGIRIIEQTESLTRAALSGRLDTMAVRDMEKQFNDQVISREKHVILDMYEATFLSSMAMRLLLTAAKELAAHGAKMVLLNPHRLAELGLKAAGLNDLMHIEHDESRALEFIKNA